MKETYWGYWLIMLGVFIIIILMLVSNVTTKNTQDYYLIKEVTQAAMVDAINYGYYREYGELKIDREVFIEAFIRRFSENVNLNTYYIDFYDLYEAPPKVSVRVTSSSNTFNIMGDQASFDIVNKVDAILELLPQNNSSTSSSSSASNSSSSSSSNNNNNTSTNTNNITEPDTHTELTLGSLNVFYKTKGLIGDYYINKYEYCFGYEEEPSDSGLWRSAYSCNTNGHLKTKYKNNPTMYVNEFINDWQKEYGITLNASQRASFDSYLRNKYNL